MSLYRRLVFIAFVITCSACAPTIVYRDALPTPVIAAPVTSLPNGAIYQPHNNRLLFEDLKARRRGDLITVILDETTVAAKNASTRASRGTSIDISAPNVLGNTATLNGNPAAIGLESGSDFSGSGDSSQSNSLFGNITATVIDITPNGNLVIEGAKKLTLNSGNEIIKVSGIVRPTDLTPQNTIVSTLIANGNIEYSGRGMIADSNKSGWITRLLTSPFWPF